ncbi:MAG: ScpA family protein [Candidatus Colwellbacteria bacterium]|nr:ScpA family protein [Candidatus Colwellbacteria bacterium]
MGYEISLENFSGPLQKLLELIEEKKYEITTVNLAKVTGDFLDHVREVEKMEPRLLAEFIAVAAKLILIKSKSLIPDLELTPEEEGDIRDLESRLKLYKEFKQAESGLNELWNRGLVSYPREPASALDTPVFYPPSSLSAELLGTYAAALHKTLSTYQNDMERYEVVNFEEYVAKLSEEVIGRISKFSSLAEKKEKTEVILLFLALLHLLKDAKISIDQEGQFSEITIKPNV